MRILPLADVKARLSALAAVDLHEAEVSRAAGEVYSTEEVLADFEARRSQRG